jgi:hypothetical protein
MESQKKRKLHSRHFINLQNAKIRSGFCKKKVYYTKNQKGMSDLPICITVDQVPPIKMYDEDFRTEVAVMYNAVMKHDCAEAMSKSPQDMIFMFSSTDWMEKVSTDPEVLACGHSGATEALCFRYVRAILQGSLKLLPTSDEIN